MTTQMPRIGYVPATEAGVINVQLTKPTTINTGNPSSFPMREDVFKNLNYQSAAQSELNSQMKQYYDILSKIMGGTATTQDIANLETITSEIREYVLTDDDYNLVIGALQNMQAYVIRFMYGDITNKAKAMDTELNKVITEVDRFMTQLEQTYYKSPSDYPIPNNSVYRPKLEAGVVKTLDYVDAVEGVIVSNTKPANPQGKSFIWYNTGAKR
jgi:hypothetical protein